MIKSLFGKVELSIGDSYFGPVILLLTIQNKTKKKTKDTFENKFLGCCVHTSVLTTFPSTYSCGEYKNVIYSKYAVLMLVLLCTAVKVK